MVSDFPSWRQQGSAEQLSAAICVYGKAETIKTCWQLWVKLQASCSVIYVKSWRTISSSWFFKETQPVTCFWQWSLCTTAKGIWVQGILRCAGGAREQGLWQPTHTLPRGGLGAAAFSGFRLTPLLTNRQARAQDLQLIAWCLSPSAVGRILAGICQWMCWCGYGHMAERDAWEDSGVCPDFSSAVSSPGFLALFCFLCFKM